MTAAIGFGHHSKPNLTIRKIHPEGVACAPTSGFVPTVVYNEFVFDAGQMRHSVVGRTRPDLDHIPPPTARSPPTPFAASRRLSVAEPGVIGAALSSATKPKHSSSRLADRGSNAI